MWPAWVVYALITLVSVGISLALAPKAPKPRAAALEDFDLPTAQEGRPIPVVFGTVKVTGINVLWYGGLRTRSIKTKSGKK